MFFHSHKSNQNSPTNPFAVLLILTDMRHTQGKRALSRRLPVKLSNRQTRRHENRTDGHKYGGGRKYTILRPSGKSRMKAYPAFCSPPCHPAKRGLRTARRPASGPGGKTWQNVIAVLYGKTLQIAGKNAPKPRFPPLSTVLKISLRQENSVFAARRKFLSAKKFDFCRTKTPATAEKCSYEAFLRPSF